MNPVDEGQLRTDESDRRERRPADVAGIQESARRIREYSLRMGAVQGQGYIGQALGVADVLAVLYRYELRHRPGDPEWPERDRLLLSVGHYAIALYAALAEAGVLELEDLDTYGADGSRLPMSGMATYTPGMEISGGSLGHGLGIAVGMGLGMRLQGRRGRIYDLLSDGELDEGSTWEAALAASHHRLTNVTAVVDVNQLQADGPTTDVMRTEPVAEKWEAFGWHAIRVDGNSVRDVVAGFDRLRQTRDRPTVLVCETRVGKGVAFLEERERAHFMRVDSHEWARAIDEVRRGSEGG